MNHRKTLLIPLVAVAMVSSCATKPALDEDYAERARTFESVIELEFVTNRAIDVNFGGQRYYSNELGDLSGGTCAVGMEAGEDGDGKLIGVTGSTVLRTLSTLDASAERGIVVYFHGYFEDFERSCRRAATFKRRLDVDMGFLLFSWPANSTPLTYGDDLADLEASTPVILETLEKLGRRFAPRNISIIGHSLGSRGLVKTLGQRRAGSEKFRDLILVAADIDRDIFIEALPTLKSHIEDVTVFASDRDLALKLSETVNQAPRLGQSGSASFEGVTVIDVTNVANTHFSGHAYHLRNGSIVDMIRQVLLNEREEGQPRAVRLNEP